MPAQARVASHLHDVHKAPRPRSVPNRRKRKEIFEDPLQFLWAISYSDLLMVLMCFFIIYFEMDDVVPVSQVVQLVATTPSTSEVTPPLPAPLAKIPTIIDRLSSQLKEAGMTVNLVTSSEGAIIDFSDGIYQSGQYSLSPSAKVEVKHALDLILPLAHSINLTFIGHADMAPIARPDNRIIDSNLVLSNLRATRAAEFAVNLGFDSRQVTAQGMGEHSRKSRSLSLKISERKEDAGSPAIQR